MKIRYSCVRGAFASCLLFLASTAAFSQDAIRSDLLQAFREYDLIRTASVQKQTGPTRFLQVRADGREFNLTLTPHDLRSAGYRAEDVQVMGVFPTEDDVEINTFKGTIQGSPNSEVRVTIDANGVLGYFEENGARYFIEPAGKYSGAALADQAVVYREEDIVNREPFFCNIGLPTQIEAGAEMAGVNAVNS